MTPTHGELPAYARTGYWYAGCGPDELPWATRRLVLWRDDFACVCCNRPVFGQPYAIHVRGPRDRGRDRSPENLITVLGECDERMSLGREPADVSRGYNVPPCQDPALVPVAYVTATGHANWWLLADGGRSPECPSGALPPPRQAAERVVVHNLLVVLASAPHGTPLAPDTR